MVKNIGISYLIVLILISMLSVLICLDKQVNKSDTIVCNFS